MCELSSAAMATDRDAIVEGFRVFWIYWIMYIVAIELAVRVNDKDALVDSARTRDHLARQDIAKIGEVVPEQDGVAALRSMFHEPPSLPGCEVVSMRCRANRMASNTE